jgi:hypothetical protein
MDKILLQCVKVGSKLRVRIVTPGYYHDANCMFPRDLRIEGRMFRVNPGTVQLITTRGKYYYCVKDKSGIEIAEEGVIITPSPDNLKVFEDLDDPDCCICLSEPKSIIVNPCGHFYMCKTCCKSVTKCPICRIPIKGFIDRENFE